VSKEIVVIGGGITGLVAGYISARQGNQVKIIESSGTFGGLLNTFEVGGTRLEYYYHHFFTHDAELHWLIKELNLEDRLFYRPSTMGVFRNGEIYPFNSPLDLLKFKPLGLFDKLRFGVTSMFLGKVASWRGYENVSCLDWFYRWAGKGVTECVWYPLLNIKFGSYAPVIPLSWMVGRLRQRLNSRRKAKEELGYLRGSLQVLLDAIVGKLKAMGVELIDNSPVTSLKLSGDKIVGITAGQTSYTADQFLFTIPGPNLAKLTEQINTGLSTRLSAVEYFGAVCVVLEMDRPLSDVYWLNIAEKGFPFGGIIEQTNFVPSSEYGGLHIAYLSRYFSKTEDIAKMTESEIKELMISALSMVYKEFDRGWILKTSIFRTYTAATVCDLDFSKKVPDCKTEIEGLYLVNMSHIYPDERSANNSVRAAAEACRVMGMNTDFIPRNSSLSAQIGFQ
jgi:protoporphyrinogen oxidase